MERVSPTVHLGVLCCIFGTTLVAFLTLLGANTYKISIRGKRRQTGAVLSKLVLDLVPVILASLNFAERTSLDESKLEAYFYSRHTVIDHLVNRNHSVGRLHPALLLLHMYNRLRGKSWLYERYRMNTHNQFKHLYLWITFDQVSNTGLGWIIHHHGLGGTLVLNISLFLPLIK